jgi:hypothetical protein
MYFHSKASKPIATLDDIPSLIICASIHISETALLEGK